MDIRALKDNKYLWFGISTLIILAMVYFADVGDFIQSLRSADPLPLIPALMLGLAVFPAWSYVWYRVFRSSGINVSYRRTLEIFMAGDGFMNAITPLGQFGGEPIMAYLVKDNSNASYEGAISSVFSADIMNAIPQMTFIIGGSLYIMVFKTINQVILQALYIALFATVIGGVFVYLLWFEAGTIEGKLLAILGKISSVLGRGEGLVESAGKKLDRVEQSFRAIGESPVYLIKTAFISHLGFLFQVFNFYFIMSALGFTPEISPIYFVVVLAGLANFSPTPGGSGTYEAAMAGLVTIFFPGTSFATGLTVAILFRLSTYWPGLLLGWIAFNRLQNGGS